MNQSINGDGNIQAGRDVNLSSNSKPPLPDDANGVNCPQCGEWTWKHSNLCIYCQYNLANHFEFLRREKSKKELMRTSYTSLSIAGVCAIIITINGPNLPLIGMMIFLFMIGYVMMEQASRM